MQLEIRKTVGFEAAHHLPLLPEDHKCHRLHGHGYTVTVGVTGDLDPTGMVIELGFVKSWLTQLVVGPLDHQCLNEIDGLENPTAENLVLWIVDRMRSAIPPRLQLTLVEVRETASAVFRWIP